MKELILVLMSVLLAGLGLLVLWVIGQDQNRFPDHRDLSYTERPQYRLFMYGRDQNLFSERIPDKEIEYKIRKAFWNPRYTKPHWPWDSGNTDPPGLHLIRRVAREIEKTLCSRCRLGFV